MGGALPLCLAFGVQGGVQYFLRNCRTWTDEDRPFPGVCLAQRIVAWAPVPVGNHVGIGNGNSKYVEEDVVPFSGVAGEKTAQIGFEEIEAHHEAGPTAGWGQGINVEAAV